MKMRDLAAALLHAGSDVFADEVQRNVHPDLLVLDDALEVHVHDLVLRRMALQILQDRGLALLTDLDIQDARIERLVLELLQDLVVVKYQCAGRTPGAVDNCGYFS